MPPRSNRTFQRTLSNNSNTSSSSSSSKPKLKQNKLDFSFHSTSSSTRPFASRPLSSTPSFGLPATVPTAAPQQQQQQQPAALLSTHKGKQRQHDTVSEVDDPFRLDHADSLWCERLAPHSAEELAIHPKKVAQVRTWLEEACSSRPELAKHRKVLALTGPAGAGKSATVRALASDLDLDVLEWHNDQPSFDPNAPGSSFVERFTDFLSKAAKFPTLEFQADGEDAEGSSSSFFDSATATARRRIILLEDLPNLHHLPTKQLFQASLQNHIHQSIHLTSRGFANVPIILIVTESTPREDQDRWAGDSSGTTWSERIASIMDTRTALGEAIRKHPAYTEVRFNPVAPTIILKGLKRALEKASPAKSAKAWVELLQAIADDSNGDLRAAVNCLQFVGAKQLEAVQSRGAKGGQDVKKAVRKLIPLVSGRESSLALFHALGKVLYNKREGDPGDDVGPNAKATANRDSDDNLDPQSDNEADRTQLQIRLKRAMQAIIPPSTDSIALCELPEHMSHLDRRTSRVQPDQVWADLPVDSSIFQLYLHQNLPQFTTEIEQCESILEEFSTADVLTPLHEGHRFSTLSAYYAFLTCVRGTLLHLPTPVPRSGQKLGKATWWDVQKKLRTVLMDVEDIKASSSQSWRTTRESAPDGSGLKRTRFSQPSSLDDVGRFDAGLGESTMQTTLLRSDSVTLVTETLPLLAKIEAEAFDGKVAELTRMRFEYAGVADIAGRVLDEYESGVVAEEDADEVGMAAKDDKHGTKRKFKAQQEEEKQRAAAAAAADQENLILSDDDIDDF